MNPPPHPLLSLSPHKSTVPPFNLQPHLKSIGANLVHLYHQYLAHLGIPRGESKKHMNLYHQLRRRLISLEKAGYIDLRYDDSRMVWAYPRSTMLNLIKQVQNSNHPQNPPSGPFAWPKRCRPERIEAVKRLADITDMVLFQRIPTGRYDKRGKEIKLLNPELEDRLIDVSACFDDYTEWVEDRVIVMVAEHPDRTPGHLEIPYRTRFNDGHRKLQTLEKFDGAWAKTLTRYDSGVILTLTTDPKRHKSLWHANRAMGMHLNTYFSLLKKRFGERLRYIAVYEFQENGLIHAHIAMFGMRYLYDQEDISSDWQRIGQGEIVHVYGIRNNGTEWVWRKEKPSDAKGKKPQDYLRKYVRKGMYESEGFALYWAINKRFYSNSQIFTVKIEEAVKNAIKLWQFFGTFKSDEVPAEIHVASRAWTGGLNIMNAWELATVPG